MAPTPQHRKRNSLRTRASPHRSTARIPSKLTAQPEPPANSSRPTPPTKKAKREQKQSDWLSRTQNAGIQKAPLKRRRPGKKLQAAEDVSALRDALPDLDEDEEEEEGWEGFSDSEGTAAAVGGRKRRQRRPHASGHGKIIMKSLKHRPGALKRKWRMEGREMERFGRNLAQLAGSVGTVQQRDGTAQGVDGVGGGGVDAAAVAEGRGQRQKQKWEALRAFIGKTMKRKEGLEGG